MLDQEGLRIFLELKHVPTEHQRVQVTGHYVLKLLQKRELSQDSQQDRTVKAFTVVAHQNWSAEVFKEEDEPFKSLF